MLPWYWALKYGNAPWTNLDHGTFLQAATLLSLHKPSAENEALSANFSASNTLHPSIICIINNSPRRFLLKLASTGGMSFTFLLFFLVFNLGLLFFFFFWLFSFFWAAFLAARFWARRLCTNRPGNLDGSTFFLSDSSTSVSISGHHSWTDPKLFDTTPNDCAVNVSTHPSVSFSKCSWSKMATIEFGRNTHTGDPLLHNHLGFSSTPGPTCFSITTTLIATDCSRGIRCVASLGLRTVNQTEVTNATLATLIVPISGFRFCMKPGLVFGTMAMTMCPILQKRSDKYRAD